MRILIVNRFAPPDGAPTAVLAGELAECLMSRGHDIELISCSTGYRKGSKTGIARALEELLSHAQLLLKLISARRGDFVLCLSSPACLPVSAALGARIRGMRFGHWAMDVYPEIAAALGELSRNGVIYRLSARLMSWAYGTSDLLVALDSDMRQVFVSKGFEAEICPPWAPLDLDWLEIDPGAGNEQEFTWLYSGNLGRAHEWRCLLEAQALLEKDTSHIALVFQGGGAATADAQRYSDELGLKRCRWQGYVKKEEILATLFGANVLVATQRAATLGLLWPSKLAVIKDVPRPLLWIGPAGGSICDSLSTSSPVGSFEPHQTAEIANWIRSQAGQSSSPCYSPRSLHERESGARRMVQILEKAIGRDDRKAGDQSVGI